MSRALEQAGEIAKTIGGFVSSICIPLREEYRFDERDIQRRVVQKERVTNTLPDHRLKIVSWNILREYNPQEIKKSLSEIIKNHNPNVLLLQEAAVRDGNGFWQDHLFTKFNAAYAPLHHVARKTKFYDFDHSGQLTLAQFPYREVEVYALPLVAQQSLGKNHLITRIALYTQIENAMGLRIGIYNVHLENRTGPSGREYQIRSLLETIEQKNDDVVVVGGDFNTFLGSKLERGIDDLERAGFKKGFVKEGLLPQLDYFFYRGDKIRGASGKQLQGEGSDHQPILLELEWK